ncbi:TonB-dependent receptor [Luteolibacter sp. GHJ8]|uniref:TonB-dependent receptor n=1 Tax=Luteolibacter rhizosphaerae TaxID=2989719 RepID=A0ABT3FXV4_9BACT|nr:TonB-dependent receptor [Luteolibacter rhizosphaerae]MCW1912418.1 TonB-dependent receptor [Luteolibacter rhizosphaerae]
MTWILRGQDLLEELPEEEALEEIVVTADSGGDIPPSLADFSIQKVQSIPEEVLRRNAQASLGETLAWEPGVSSGYFGPGASRPVLRGFEGVRVRMLRDDLGTFDLSDISPDHGVALEPALLDGIEIHRGPASLLYGNSAIGGAVNARSKVIARERMEKEVSGAWETRYDSQGSGRAGAGHLSLATGPWVLRFTGSARKAEDIAIGGRARTPAYQALENPQIYQPGSGALIDVPNPDGMLPNSAHQCSTWSAGLSLIPEQSPLRLGISYSRFDTRYGVPYLYPGDATDLFGDYTLELMQDRLDLEASLAPEQGPVKGIDLKLGYADYDHEELFRGLGKDAGRDYADTILAKDAFEARLDVRHEALDGRLSGTAGISANMEQLTATRAIYPPPDFQQARNELRGKGEGIYLLEKYQSGEWTGQLGYRLEASRVKALSSEQSGYVRGESGYSQSLSSALTWDREGFAGMDRLAITGMASRIERLPTATERYAFWHNAGIGRFLIGGDMDGTPLSTEASLGVELGIEAEKGPVNARVNGYHYDFDNFIFLQEAPELTGGFGRAVQYIERAATFTGFEAEIDWEIMPGLRLNLMSDYVRAENRSDHEPIPRMPPLRFGTRVEWKNDRVTVGLEARHATAQERVKPAPRAELPSDDYTLVNADMNWELPVEGQKFEFFLRLSNLLDEEGRVSTSFRKDVAPLPGRGLSLGLRHEF